MCIAWKEKLQKNNPRTIVLKKITAYAIAPSSFTVSCFTYPHHLKVNINAEYLNIFVLRKKGSKTKERMTDEEIEKGDCEPPTRKVRRESNAFAGYTTPRWCIRLTRLTLVCEVIGYCLVQVRQNLKNKKKKFKQLCKRNRKSIFSFLACASKTKNL